MKLTTFLLLVSVLGVLANKSYSQTLDLKMENATLKEVLSKIEDMSQCNFLYSEKFIDVQRKVSINFENTKLDDALKTLFTGTDIEFERKDRIIILSQHTDASGQQQKTISGRVIDSSGVPLPGVTVVVKGTTQGTITDGDGNYSLPNVPANTTLIFSFVGMKSQEISVTGKTTVNVTMVEDAIGIEEVVAIGYGSMKKTDITGSVASISEDDFKDKPLNNIAQALAGRIAGLDVVSTGGSPGDVAQIRLRGRRSFVASNEPLIILDGIPFYGSINDINPYDIISVDVLKDASSTAIYGSQGANGVILITTKRGQIGKAQFTVESHGGIVSRYGNLPLYNGEEFANRAREAARAAGSYPDDGQIHDEYDQLIFTSSIEYDNMKAGKSANYQDDLFQNGYQQKHQISVRGGSEAVKYNFAANVFDEEGILPTNKFNRYSLRSNLDFTLSPKFTIGTSLLLQYNVRSRKQNPASISEARYSSPLGSPTEEDGTPRFDPNNDGFRVNPLADLLWDSYRYDDKRWGVFANIFAEYKILPALTYRLNLGADVSTNKVSEYAGQRSIARRGDVSTASIDNNVATRKTYESILTFDKKIGSHDIKLTGVHSIQTSRVDSTGLDVSKIPYDLSLYHNVGSAEIINSVGSNLVEANLISYVGRFFYGYKGKYLLQFTLRADGASQFADNNKWGYFPSASFAWRISEEDFLNSSDWVSNLKLRLGYGMTGNRAIDPYQSQGGLIQTDYSWGESTAAYGQRPSELANKDLKWESTEVFNLGLDFGFLQGRINGNIELYKTNTYDLLMYRKLPITTGFDQVLENIGSTSNKGLEIGLNTSNVIKPHFKWNSNFVFYLNREEIVELYQGKVDDIGNRWFIGQPIHVYYDYKKSGIWQLDEADEASVYGREPGQIKLMDVVADDAITDADRVIIGTREPKFVLDFTNTFTYKQWDLSFETYLRWGQTASVPAFQRESINRLNSLKLDYWTADNPTNAQPRPDNRSMQYTYGSTLTYVDGSFLKIRQLTLGYTFPKSFLSKMNISSARLYVSGDNLWYWTKNSDIKDFNLEPDRAEDIGVMPAVRSIIAGVNISF